MKKNRTIGHVLLIGLVFTFPILFQSLHIIGHHLHEDSEFQNFSGTPVFYETVNQCPILTFEFSVLDSFPKLYTIEKTEKNFTLFINHYVSLRFSSKVDVHLLRAPPVI